MSGYLSFERTGHKEVDDILSMIEKAGDGYHHTEMWIEGDPSYHDMIDEKIRLARIILNK